MTKKMIRLSGNHYEIGFQHGTQLNNVITNTVVPFVREEINDHGISADDIGDITRRYETLLEKAFPEIIDETRGIADGAELDYQTALLVLLFWEVRDTASHENHSLPDSDCSSFVAAGDATDGDIHLATQNSDWPLRMHGKNLPQVFHISPEDRYRFIGRGLAGNLGRPSVVGFNEEGLAFVGSGIVQTKGADFGFPPLTITRIGLETCSTVDEFVELVRKIPSWGHAGENVDVVDKNGNMVRVSFSTKRVCTVQTKNHFLVSTNHYHNSEMSHFGPEKKEDYISTFTRYERLVELVWENYGEINRDVAESIMSDHKYGNRPPEGNKSICRHGPLNETLCNMLSLPSKKEFWISDGTPCEGDYLKYRL
ncbi:MAG: C45 family peptidase [Candidatus Thorarchaeota archaeon]